MRKQIWALGAILFSTALYIMGNGLIGVLIPVRANLEHFSNLSLGIIGSFYFAGFVIGCFAGPRLLVRAGHSRTFGIGAGISAATILLQSIFVSEFVWILARGAFGLAAACIYMVIESWLNDRASNANRGRIFSVYLTVNFSSIIVGQMMFGTASPSSFALFSTAAILYALSLIPMGLTQLPQPHASHVPVLRPLRLYGISPVGVMGCIAVGFANSAVWTLAPVYAQAHGLNKGWIAVFMSVFTLGGAAVQLPLGRLSDRMDRRYIIAFVSVAAAAFGIALATFGGAHHWTILPLIALFGSVALPLYGLSVAHANDRMAREDFVEASATLLLINSLSSVGGPTLPALAIGWFGTSAVFFYTAAIHLAMGAFVIA
ncbi:MAG TPA: MFS transporter, partial [Rhizomicrobium sp.]